jgi:hypothetical protein
MMHPLPTPPTNETENKRDRSTVGELSMHLAEDETEDGASGTTPDDTTAEMTTPTDRVEVPCPIKAAVTNTDRTAIPNPMEMEATNIPPPSEEAEICMIPPEPTEIVTSTIAQ